MASRASRHSAEFPKLATAVFLADPAGTELASAVQVIHRHCGVFTSTDVARIVLDTVGWNVDESLDRCRLLEPACGNGSFLLPAATSLIASLRRRGLEVSESTLRDAIVAFEFDDSTAAMARTRLSDLLEKEGLSDDAARKVAGIWVRCEDFLLAGAVGDFTHVVGNPPYMRWSKVPRELRDRYRRSLPASAARGDFCLPFVWRAFELTEARNGSVAFVCADRWLRCAYGEHVPAALAGRVRVARHVEVHDAAVFVSSRRVDAYAAVTILDRRLDRRPTFAKAATVEALRDILSERLGDDAATGDRSATDALRTRGGAMIAHLV